MVLLIVFDGMIPVVVLPDWVLLVLLEVFTVVVEVGIICSFWALRDGKVRWWHWVVVVTIANLVTAVGGVLVYALIKDEVVNGFWYMSSAMQPLDLSFLFVMYFSLLLVVVMQLVMVALSDCTEQDKPEPAKA